MLNIIVFIICFNIQNVCGSLYFVNLFIQYKYVKYMYNVYVYESVIYMYLYNVLLYEIKCIKQLIEIYIGIYLL